MGRGGYSFLNWGLMTGGKGRVYVPSIGMINLTMVVNSTNIIISLTEIMIL